MRQACPLPLCRTGKAFLKPGAATAAAALAAAAPAARGLKGPGAGFKPVVAGGFKPVAGAKLGGGGGGEPAKAHALHDPHVEGAVVLNRWAGTGIRICQLVSYDRAV